MKVFIFIFLLQVNFHLKRVFGDSNGLFVLTDPVFLSPNDQTNVEFGFSLSLYQNQTHKSLLVGAPAANTSQVGVTSAGALYSCDLSSDVSTVNCVQLQVDVRNAEQKYVPFIDEDLKDHQRLGASLSTKGNQVLVCAPNWHYYEKRVKQTIDAPVGICFRSTNLEQFTPFSVPYDATVGNTVDYLNYGSCQSGFSSVITQDMKVVLGSPGCFNWEGEVFSETSSGFISFGKGFPSEVISEVSDGDDLIWLSNMYLGYSVEEGHFNGQNGIAVGMPRTAQVSGQNYGGENFVANPMVTIHVRGENTLQLWTTLSPPRNEFGLLDSVWLFSYFGYSVTVADVDGNELDDVIIGAPFYHNETNYDQGAILVYLQFKKEEKGEDNQHYYMSLESSKSLRVGLTDQGRFGSSVSNVKDLDGDGIDDIAVGAPFAENGYVYIYLGSPEGLSEIPHQILRALDDPFRSRNLKGFGSSFASINPSSNSVKQKDLAIGAFPSDAVVIIKSKVMISVDWDVDFPSKMDLKSKCKLRNEYHPCAQMNTCISYSHLQNAKKGDEKPIDFSVTYRLDVNVIPHRLFFDNLKTYSVKIISAKYKEVTCYKDLVYMIRDLNNLEAFEVITNIAKVPDKAEEVALQTREVTSLTDFLEISFECKFSNVSACISDLHLETQTFPDVVLAESVRFDVLYSIKNFGEPSYSNSLQIETDPLLEISGKAKLDERNSTVTPVVDCRRMEETLIYCTLGTFINANDVLKLTLTFVTKESFLELENLRSHENRFQIKSSLSTLSEIKVPEDAKTTNYVAIETKPEIYLSRGETSTDLVSLKEDFPYEYPSETENESNIGPEIIHIYEIYNKMNYAVENNLIELYWPFKMNDKELLDGVVTITPPNANCRVSLMKGFVDDDTKNISSFGNVTWKMTSCEVLYLQPQTSVLVRLQLRLAMKTVMEDIYNPDFDEVRSYAKLISTPILLGLKFKLLSTNNILTRIDYGDMQFKVVPIYIYVLGVALGLILLIILVYCLRKQTNFFKREKLGEGEPIPSEDVEGPSEAQTETRNEHPVNEEQVETVAMISAPSENRNSSNDNV
ncbi:UNVERIFIED_CONTAM: hypothetical protein RMT77_000389 [Armadillidium vulgare]